MNFTRLLSLSFVLLAFSLIECTDTKLPIVYHPGYNISLFGLEKLHPFDSCKYGHVYDYLIEQQLIKSSEFHQPTEVTNQQLLIIHPQSYLDSLDSLATLARITEIPIDYIPQMFSSLVLPSIITPMRLATGGTILATQLALKKGWAINLGGGYHHAKDCEGGGFCAFADIPLAINILLQKNSKLQKVLIIDLDAHQGNGHEWIFRDNDAIAIFDIYNEDIYPHDEEAKKAITYNHPVHSGINDARYLALLKKQLPIALADSKPDFIVYNAGTDILAGDTLGRMNISKQGIIERDAFVFGEAFKRNIPITMVLSGGYTKQSAGVISKSVENLLTNVITPRREIKAELTPENKPIKKFIKKSTRK